MAGPHGSGVGCIQTNTPLLSFPLSWTERRYPLFPNTMPSNRAEITTRRWNQAQMGCPIRTLEIDSTAGSRSRVSTALAASLEKGFWSTMSKVVRKRGSLEKWSFQKSPFSRDSRECRNSRISREPPDHGKERRFRRFSRESREFRDFRDSRDFSSEKTPFVMTPLSGSECKKW